MYSQCPECLTRFRVTAAALRAAHGTVRCGRCSSAFDALVRLSDTLPDEAEVADAPATMALAAAGVRGNDETRIARGVSGPGAAEFHFSADDIEQVFVDARDWQQRFGAVPEPEVVETGSPETSMATDFDAEADELPATASSATPPVYVHEPEAVEDITLEGERIVIEGVTDFDDEFYEGGGTDAVPLPVPPGAEATPPVDLESTDRFEALKHVPDSAYPELPEDEPAGAQQETSTAEFVGAEPTAPATASTTAVALEPEPPAPQSAVAPAADEVAAHVHRSRWDTPLRGETAAASTASQPEDLPLDEEAPQGTGRAALAWGIGALLLALVLAAQLAHFYRQQLARDANVGPIVRDVYSRLGLPLPPNWDLAAFELRQWGASEPAPSAEGRMRVRASLRNGASYAQPMPLLRLELEDRFGETVARRDFEPREYLKDPGQATRLLAPNAATEAELAIVDAANDAVGYRLDVCMRDEDGAVRCAQPTSDTAPR